MPNAADIAWFKENFSDKIEARIQGTLFSLDFLCALACQETGEIWPVLRRAGMSATDIVRLCVGDTIDGDPATGKGRRAFPRNKAELIARKDGQKMFDIAHTSLVEMAKHIKQYEKPAANPNKFCHGYGVFQRDLQAFKTDPEYFLSRRYEVFNETLNKCVERLSKAASDRGFAPGAKLSELQLASVAIMYNTGKYIPSKGLQQGYKPKDGPYYGEQFVTYLRLAATISPAAPPIQTQVVNEAIPRPPSAVFAQGKVYRVDTVSDPLTLRSEPRKTNPDEKSNRVASLPDNSTVRSFDEPAVNGFLRVQTTQTGALLTGYAFAGLLKPVVASEPVRVVRPPTLPPGLTIPEAYLPVKAGRLIRRADPAGPFSLNEAGQPSRSGQTAAELKESLAKIIDWLKPEAASHLRYKPTSTSTFCNIYAHDFCHLAGIYLPRVWWTQPALLKLGAGQQIKAEYGVTVDEIRANGLFRWLSDFGPTFGWRQTGTLTKLQVDVNQGAVGVIVARRVHEGRPGHIVIVVPETPSHKAIWNTSGDVTSPLQCQAGSKNFSYGTGNKDWWLGGQFADHAFWVHS